MKLFLLGSLGLAAAVTPATAEKIDTNKPVKVFVLAGQSNMQGHGRITMGKDGDLPYAAKQEQFCYLKDGDDWAEREDVWYYHKHDNCTAVETRKFQIHKPGRQKSHWHNSAESYCLVGDASAKAMIEILSK